MRPAFAKQSMRTMHVSVNGSEDHNCIFTTNRIDEAADRPSGGLDVGVISHEFTPGLFFHLPASRYVEPQLDRRLSRRKDSGAGCIIWRMRRLQAHHHKPRFES